jgi:hypothetical protein
MDRVQYDREQRKADALKEKLAAQLQQIQHAEELLHKKQSRAETRRLKHIERAVRLQALCGLLLSWLWR